MHATSSFIDYRSVEDTERSMRYSSQGIVKAFIDYRSVEDTERKHEAKEE